MPWHFLLAHQLFLASAGERIIGVCADLVHISCVCSFLHIFLGFTVLFTFIKDYATQNYCSPEGTEREGQGKAQLVFAQTRLGFAHQSCLEKDQAYFEYTSQPRRFISFKNPSSNEHGRGRSERDILPLEMPLWEDQQEVRSRVCDLLGLLEEGHSTSNSTQTEGDIWLAGLGQLGRRLKLGIKPLIESVIYKISPRWRCHSPAQSPEAYSEGQERERREREREEGRVARNASESWRNRIDFSFSTGRQFCALDTDGHSPIHAHHSFALEPIFLLDASKHIQRKARDGRALAQGISRPSQNARRYQAFYRENRTGDGKNGDQELAPSYEVLGQGEEAPAGSHRPKTCPPLPLDGPFVQWNQDVGKTTGRLPKTSGDTHGTCRKGKDPRSLQRTESFNS